MNQIQSQLQKHARRLFVLALLGALYLMARLPDVPGAEKTALARRFQFERAVLPKVPGAEIRGVRPVHPSVQHIAAWISGVGAAVALNDLDGDGLPNDLCYVDTRTDQVIVAPAPGTGARYAPFALDSGGLYRRETMAPMGCLPGDMNEDGRMDLLVYYWGRTPVAFLRQDGAMGAAAYRALDIAPGGDRWYTNAATFADLDGDGHPDLVIGNYFPDGSRLLDANDRGTEHMQHSMSRALNGGRDRLMLWQPDGAGFRYCDMPGVLSDEVALGWTLAVGAADLDGDLLPEIYFANDFGPDRLLHNRSTPGHLEFAVVEGRRTAGVPASRVIGRDSFKGMAVDFGDINHDGWPDIFVSNIANPWALEESHFLWISTGKVDQFRSGVAPYVDRGEALGVSRSGWAWDARLVDFDNDGRTEIVQAVGFLRGESNRWPEMHEVAMGNDQLLEKSGSWHYIQPGDDLSGHLHNPFYVTGSDGRFYDVAHEMGIDDSHVSRGIAVADIDGDGKLDFAVANQWEDSLLFRNTSPNAGAFLGLRNAPIGMRATVGLPDGRTMTAQADGGSGHSGKRSHDIHFGLGATPPDRELPVELKWRDRSGVHSRRMKLKPGWHDARAIQPVMEAK